MLVVQSVEKRFGDVIALDGVRLTVGRGGIVGFLGPNGAGKTTTMRAVMGLIAIDGGALTWDGRPINAGVRRRFGYMPAERGMYPKMQVRDEIVYFARLAGMSPPAAGAAADEWIERLGLSERANDEVQALSSGNQQRVQLAISLVHGPELLILDEPFSGLDPVAVETMKDVLAQELQRGVAVLFSSHQLDLVADVSRDVVIIDAGRIVLEGDVADIRGRAPTRYADVTFRDDTEWYPPFADAEVVHRSGRAVRVRVPAARAAEELLASAEAAGPIVEFAFAPPDLSEVFLGAVAGRVQPSQPGALR